MKAHESPRTCRAPGKVGGARREGDAEKPGFLETQVKPSWFSLGHRMENARAAVRQA